MYRLVDTHAHLDEINTPEEAVSGAKSSNVIAIIAVGSDYESNQTVLHLASTYRGFVYPALGWHPSKLKSSEIDRNLEFIEAHIDNAVGIGEIGLDYHSRIRATADKELQKYVLREILKIGRAHQKPVIIHSRYAWRDALNLVEEAEIKNAVFHWYTGPSSVLTDIIRHQYYISATPAVAYHEEHQKAIKEIPLDNLLLETDSPVVYGRGSDTEYESRPADLLQALRSVASIKGIGEAKVAEATTANALRLFSLPL